MMSLKSLREMLFGTVWRLRWLKRLRIFRIWMQLCIKTSCDQSYQRNGKRQRRAKGLDTMGSWQDQSVKKGRT